MSVADLIPAFRHHDRAALGIEGPGEPPAPESRPVRVDHC